MNGAASIALIADTEELFSYALAALLKDRLNFHEVLSVSRFSEASRILAANSSIDFAAIDIALPDMNGLNDIAKLRVDYPELRLAVIARSSGRDDILRALIVGIHGYIPRRLEVAEVVQALELINSGHIYVPSALSEVGDDGAQVTSGRSLSGSPDRHELNLVNTRLTSRQLEVVDLIAQGKSNKQIARQLQLSEGTVKAHVSAVFKVLDVHDRASVAAFAGGRPSI